MTDERYEAYVCAAEGLTDFVDCTALGLAEGAHDDWFDVVVADGAKGLVGKEQCHAQSGRMGAFVTVQVWVPIELADEYEA